MICLSWKWAPDRSDGYQEDSWFRRRKEFGRVRVYLRWFTFIELRMRCQLSYLSISRFEHFTMTTVHSPPEEKSDFPKLPLPPFVGFPKRYHSAWSSTACGTPTPQHDTPHNCGYIKSSLRIPVDRRVEPFSYGQSSGDSPRIQRSSVAGVGPEPVTKAHQIPPTPSCGRLYEYRCPPIPKTDSIYKQAKKAEYEGNYEIAMELYLSAIDHRDRTDSAIKDYAGLLHMRGKTQEAIDFLENCSRADMVKSTAGFRNLINQLKSFQDSFSSTEPDKRDLPRLLYVTIGDGINVRISSATLPSLFPNHLKVLKMVYINPILDDHDCPISDRALIEFASHSAARKALLVNKHSALRCQWGSDAMLCSDSRIAHMVADDLCLEGTGPVVKISYAIVPNDIIDFEWPKLLQLKTVPPDLPTMDTRGQESSLQLPLIKRSVQGRPEELDLTVIEMSACEARQEMHWCLDTPSPVRSVACLL
jgi:hypothetical protein